MLFPAPLPGADLRVSVGTLDASAVHRGNLVAFSGDELLLVTDAGDQVVIARSEAAFFEIDAPTGSDVSGANDAAATLLLSNGDRLQVRDVAVEEDVLQVTRGERHPTVPLNIGLEFVRAVLLSSGDATRDRVVERQVLRGESNADTLLLTNDDRATGEIKAWNENGCRLRGAAGDTVVFTDQIAAVVLDPNLTIRPERKLDWVLVQFTDGSRLSTRSVEYRGGLWSMAAEVGFELSAAAGAVRRIDFFSESRIALSTIEPTEFVQTPFLAHASSYEFDRDANGGPLRVGGVDFGWGIGVLSGSRLAWTLDGSYKEFDVTVGVDDEARGGGSVEFVVLVDSKVAVRSGRRTGDDPPLPLGPIDLDDANQLELVVEYSDRGDILDFANWCRPTLRR